MKLWDRILNTVLVNVAWGFVYMELKAGLLAGLVFDLTH